jgi:hypothetical protein
MKTNKNTQLSLTGIHNDISFSKKEVWLWVSLPPTKYDFVDAQSLVMLAQGMSNGYSGILTSDEKGLECHLIVTTSPFRTEQWREELETRAARYNASEYLPNFVDGMQSRIDMINFKERKVYFGVKLGIRGDFSSSGSIFPFLNIADFIGGALSINDYNIPEKEIVFWEEKAAPIRRSLMNGNLNAQKVYASEIAYLAKKPFYPTMEVPEVDLSGREDWGVGELDSLVDAYIENGLKHLKIVQTVEVPTYDEYGRKNGTRLEEQTGYRATLCFSRFPDTMFFPQREPWIHVSAGFDFPTDFYSRFTLEPSRKVRKEVGQKRAEIDDTIQNMTSAGGSVNIDIIDRKQKAEELDFELNKNREPWVFGRHRLTVEGSTIEELETRIQKVVSRYKDLDIQLVLPTGDQMDLLLESMPNDTVRSKAYYQRQSLSIISAGMPTGSGNVGDVKKKDSDGNELGFIGPYIGYTTSRVLTPVFLSPHVAISQNSPPGVVITGAPGGGKSFSAFTLTYQMALQGVWCIYIDPKGDALPMQYLHGLNAKVLDLREGNDGILDPFGIGATPEDQKDLALEVLMLFLGGNSRVTPKQENAISEALNSVSSQPEPSLLKVLNKLKNSQEEEIKQIANRLELISTLPFSRLCFAPKTVEALNISNGLTIITLLGLDLPGVETNPVTYTNKNKLAIALMFLLTNYTRQLMMNGKKNHPKAIIIDEAWAVTATEQGQKLVSEVARMGRSLNTGLVLISQNMKDFEKGGVINSASTKMAFRAKDPEELGDILKVYGLDDTEANRSVIIGLRNGECLMKDSNDRIGRVQIDNWNPEMNEAFETNPEKRAALVASAQNKQ